MENANLKTKLDQEGETVLYLFLIQNELHTLAI